MTKINASSIDTTLNESKFVYNKHGVCLNPDIYEVQGKGNFDYAYIKVAQLPDGAWVYGYGWQCDNAGKGVPVCTDIKTFTSKELAEIEAVKSLKRSINQSCKDSDYLLTAIDSLLNRQLTLF